MKQWGLLVKVLVLSAGGSLLIRYVAPVWHITATSVGVLATVFLPSLVIAIALGWRFLALIRIVASL